MRDGVTFHCEARGATTVLHVRGEVDVFNASRFDEALMAAQAQAPSAVVVDLRECRYMDSSGVRVLARTSKALRSKLFVAVLERSSLSRLFEITGLERCMQMLVNDRLPGMRQRAALAAEFPE